HKQKVSRVFQSGVGMGLPSRLVRPVVGLQLSIRSIAHQEGLPKMPVPPLRQTCERYLAMLEPLVSEEELEHTRALVDEFLRSGGVGERLQRGLERRARKTENWLSEWWMQSAYLDSRMPVAVYTSPGVVLPPMHFQDRQGQMRQRGIEERRMEVIRQRGIEERRMEEIGQRNGGEENGGD
ncbi:hypothetical protein NFI96_028410, partial [Prochilodus magdalenae]